MKTHVRHFPQLLVPQCFFLARPLCLPAIMYLACLFKQVHDFLAGHCFSDRLTQCKPTLNSTSSLSSLFTGKTDLWMSLRFSIYLLENKNLICFLYHDISCSTPRWCFLHTLHGNIVSDPWLMWKMVAWCDNFIRPCVPVLDIFNLSCSMLYRCIYLMQDCYLWEICSICSYI